MASLTNEGLKEVELIVARNTIEKLKSELADARRERAEAEKNLAQQVNLGPIVEQRYVEKICDLNKVIRHLQNENKRLCMCGPPKVEDVLLEEALKQMTGKDRQIQDLTLKCEDWKARAVIAAKARDSWHKDAKKWEHVAADRAGTIKELKRLYEAARAESRSEKEERLHLKVRRLTEKLSKADRLIANLKDGSHERLLQVEHDKELAEIGAKYVALNRKYGLARDLNRRLAWQVNFYRVAHRVMEETVVGVFGKGEPDAKFVLQELSCAYRKRMEDAKDEYKGWQYDPETYRVPDIPKTLHPFVYLGTWHGNQFHYLNPFAFRPIC